MPQSSLSLFEFQPDRIDVGKLYHYVKSNIDGSQAIRVLVYIANVDYLEVLKLEPHNQAGAYVTARMDWPTFSVSLLESWGVAPGRAARPVAQMSLIQEDRYHISVMGVEDVLPIDYYPIHMYNFDFISLNFIFRHLIKPDADFTIGVLQPLFEPEPIHPVEYWGAASISFLGDDTCHNMACRKYRISGAGLKDHEGLIWVHKTAGHIENIEITIADNPEWNDFKFELQAVSHMEPAAWKNYMELEIEKLA